MQLEHKGFCCKIFEIINKKHLYFASVKIFVLINRTTISRNEKNLSHIV
jgi:hypothetical protein